MMDFHPFRQKAILKIDESKIESALDEYQRKLFYERYSLIYTFGGYKVHINACVVNVFSLSLLSLSLSVLPTNNSVPIENVVVAESGDDSEDEWDYIKVDKEIPEQDRETPGTLQPEDDKGHSKEDILSSTPPTATFDDTEFINQQTRALAEAILQPVEAHPVEVKNHHCGYEKSLLISKKKKKTSIFKIKPQFSASRRDPGTH